MPPQTTKELRKQKKERSIQKQEPAVSEKEPVHCQPASPCDDLHVRITTRAYEHHAERGYQHGYALDDWLEAEREVLGLGCNV